MGVTQATPEHHGVQSKLLRLWLHECMRVFSDRLVSHTEISRCRDIMLDVVKRTLADENTDVLFAHPLIFTRSGQHTHLAFHPHRSACGERGQGG